MAKPIDQIEFIELAPTLKSLAKAGGTTEHADWIRSGDNAKRLIQLIEEETRDQERKGRTLGKNRLEMTVEEQLVALRRANDEEKWGLGEEVFDRLATSAPAWPQGMNAFRSLRVRFGEGDAGVAKTFEAHWDRIIHVFGEEHCDRTDVRSGKVRYKGKLEERLRLLSGNSTHKDCVEWVLADFDKHLDMGEEALGLRPLADELLVMVWMFGEKFLNDFFYMSPRVELLARGYQARTPFHQMDWLTLHVFAAGDTVRIRVEPPYHRPAPTLRE